MGEIERMINKHFKKAWFLRIPVNISTPNKIAKDIEQHIKDNYISNEAHVLSMDLAKLKKQLT